MDQQLREELDDLQLAVRAITVQNAAMRFATQSLLSLVPTARDDMKRKIGLIGEKSLFHPIADEQIDELKRQIELLLVQPVAPT